MNSANTIGMPGSNSLTIASCKVDYLPRETLCARSVIGALLSPDFAGLRNLNWRNGMVPKRFFQLIGLCLVALSSAELLPAQELNFKVEDYVTTNLKTIKASKDKADLAARAFVANPSNKPVELLGLDFFKKNAVKKYPLTGGGSLSVESMGNAGPLVPAMIFATAMREVEKAETVDDNLQNKWLTRQDELLKAMTAKPTAQNPTPILQVREEQVWRQFLLEWIKAAQDKGGLRKGLQEAPYELISALVGRVDTQKEDARSGPGASSNDSFGMGTGSTGSGGYFPHHERLMNHIYHHHERRMNKVERIRARR